MANKLIPLLALVFALQPGLHAADAPAGPSAAEARLREALRSTTLQLRTAEADKATIQATLESLKAESEQQKTALTEKADTLVKQIKADKEVSDKTIGTLSNQVSKQEEEILTLKQNLNLLLESLEKWKAGYAKVSDIARGKEAERAKLAIDLARLQSKLEDAETKNISLYKTGNEILSRYEKFGLGEALTAQEPFVGTTRVKMENLVQDYQDKLSADKLVKGTVTPSKPVAVETPSAPTQTPAPAEPKPSVTVNPPEKPAMSEAKPLPTPSKPVPMEEKAPAMTEEQIIAAESKLVNQKVDSHYLLPPPKSASGEAYPLPQNDSNTTMP
jgi:hypothetical protein